MGNLDAEVFTKKNELRWLLQVTIWLKLRLIYKNLATLNGLKTYLSCANCAIIATKRYQHILYKKLSKQELYCNPLFTWITTKSTKSLWWEWGKNKLLESPNREWFHQWCENIANSCQYHMDNTDIMYWCNFNFKKLMERK